LSSSLPEALRKYSCVLFSGESWASKWFAGKVQVKKIAKKGDNVKGSRDGK
jgi:hypothetical protein